MKNSHLIIAIIILFLSLTLNNSLAQEQEQQDELNYKILSNMAGEKNINVLANIYNNESVGRIITVYFYSIDKTNKITEKISTKYIGPKKFYTFYAEYGKGGGQIIKVYKKIDSSRRMLVGTIKVPNIH